MSLLDPLRGLLSGKDEEDALTVTLPVTPVPEIPPDQGDAGCPGVFK